MIAPLGTEWKMSYCELFISRTHVWAEQDRTRVREQSLEFVYPNIVLISSREFKPVLKSNLNF